MNRGLDEKNMPLHLDETLIASLKNKKGVCLVDGEHYPPVTKATLQAIEKKGVDISALIFLGGTEKIEEPLEELKFEDLDDDLKIYSGENILETIEKVLNEKEVDLVIDLSDEPIVTYEDRFQIASSAMDQETGYLGSDFILRPPVQEEILEKPSLSIIGTGKRIGKTGVSVSIARILKKKGYDPVIVCMGRGGPQEPVLIDTSDKKVDADTLLELSESGKHAASDYLEDALLADVPTIGCRRCGGGLSGNPFSSNVLKGADMTNDLPQRFVIMEGSGSTLPPVKTDSRIVLIGAAQPLDHIIKYFGQYRIKTSDLAVVTMCEEPMAGEEKLNKIKEGIKNIKPELDYLLTKFRPEPSEDISGQKVFVASTAPETILPTIETYLEKNFHCDVVGSTNNLSNRKKLRSDLEEGMRSTDLLLTEIKAASIDIAGKYAKERGVDISFMHNETLVIEGTKNSLEEAIIPLCEKTLKKGDKR